VVGRERELAAVEELLAVNEAGLRALVLEGEPGIGKTTLWQAGLAAASPDVHVLSCRPSQAETKLSYTSVADLLASILEDGLPELPEPQRVAVDVALLRALPSERAPDRRAVATGVHSLLSRAASLTPIVLAIDDVQWLDPASAAALAFALRRLVESRVRILATARIEDGVAPDPLDFGRLLPGLVVRLRLEPLSLSGVHHVVKSELGHVFPRPVLQRIAQASGGNPLFATELARALIESDARPGPGDPLPVPDTLAALMRTRVGRLPAPAREALLACACLSNPDVKLVCDALGEDTRAALDDAEQAGVIVSCDGVIRFSHPLLASTVYASTTSERRRAMHTTLAGVVSDPEEQARHLALGAAEPDEAVASRLSAAARYASKRAAPQAAVELAQLAHRLTPADALEVHAQRELELAEHMFRAGDTGEAQRLLERFVDEQPTGLPRARALELLARIVYVAGTAGIAAAFCEQALADAETDRVLLARIHATLARVSYDDFGRAALHARAALELLDTVDDPDPEVVVHALCAEIDSRLVAGGPLAMDLVDRALELESLAPASDVADRVSASLGSWLKQTGDFEGARRWLDATHRAALEEGDDASLPYALSHLPQLEVWTGNFATGEARALEHLELAEATGQADQRRQALYNLAYVHAHMGRSDEARAEAEELLRDAEAADEPWSASNALSVLGLLELSLGDSATAARHLARNVEIRDALGSAMPLRAHLDYVQALVELGELERSEAVADEFERRARQSGNAALLALACAARGLLAAARQDFDGAAAAFDEALVEHERVTVPFDLGRTLIAVGTVQRRRGERRAARETLDRSRAIFNELGAPLWSARADAELRRIPIRRGAPEQLTPTEERVAELAASGRTNREMAQTLFMSPKTVEANLTRIYRKLGISSRAELGATMAARVLPKP
jgi:DNA-binding CsgD family transcriptional regulator